MEIKIFDHHIWLDYLGTNRVTGLTKLLPPAARVRNASGGEKGEAAQNVLPHQEGIQKKQESPLGTGYQ